MSVLIVLDSFKGSLSARNACHAFAEGVRSVSSVDVIEMPIADGGEGLIDCLKDSLLPQGWSEHKVKVTGPDAKEVTASFLIKGNEAVLEMARSSGLMLVDNQRRHVLEATSFGLGETIAAAIDAGATELRIGLGGSATNDLGLGCMQALGVRFFDSEGKELLSPIKARDLSKIRSLSTDLFNRRYPNINVTAVCDVDNPLLGMRGATRVFGAQKGAREDELDQLESSMSHVAEVLTAHFGHSVADQRGAGAAGGMGAALMWFFNARTRSGIEAVLDTLSFDRYAADADYVITGEGSFDAQSLGGKAPLGVLKRSRLLGKDVILVAGQILTPSREVKKLGFSEAFALTSFATSRSESMDKASDILFFIARQWAIKKLKQD